MMALLENKKASRQRELHGLAKGRD